MLNPKAEYVILAENIPGVCGSVGGLLQKSPIVCGGVHRSVKICKQCVVIGQPSVELKTIDNRAWAAYSLDCWRCAAVLRI